MKAPLAIVSQCPIPPGSSFVYNFTAANTAYTFTVVDWYHEQTPNLIHWYQTEKSSAHGIEPVPDSTLINDSQNVEFPVTPGKVYLF
ncbi:hypothetical protein G7Y89_g7967 [Cudoniella acicularis]|uniref:Plastocyanin-like domain-containing protein n=1 Tax=Cudoniella acicularis TaxID=354080 RepID=A0A8H4W416_9HELO|nr:hypothetical protein G7Y89_g7967 [Cudoniella acicularis]